MVPRQRAHPLLFGLTAGMPTAQLREQDAHSGRVSGVVKPGESLAQVGTTRGKPLNFEKSDLQACADVGSSIM